MKLPLPSERRSQGESGPAWLARSIELLRAEATRSAETNLLQMPLDPCLGIDLYLKDESGHPTGSLKHRLARSLFEHALCSGRLSPGVTVVEASSGSTAISEAYFARLLGLAFVAVVPAATGTGKIDLIERLGGECQLVEDPDLIPDECRRIAADRGGHFMDQFTHAERVTEWRGDDSIAATTFAQVSREKHATPDWVVVGVGTGGTSATFGRLIRHRSLSARLCVVDPRRTHHDSPSQSSGERPARSRIEGIDHPPVAVSYLPQVVDRVIQVPDAASLAAMHWTSATLGRTVGGSTGSNVWAAMQLIQEMASEGKTGSVITLMCDSGDRYSETYFSREWLASEGIDMGPYMQVLNRFGASRGATEEKPQQPVTRGFEA